MTYGTNANPSGSAFDINKFEEMLGRLEASKSLQQERGAQTQAAAAPQAPANMMAPR